MAEKLAALQAAIQHDIVEGTTESLSLLSVPATATPEKRLFVYQNAYVARLVEIIGEDYDTTWAFLGDELFYDLAIRYVHTCPSNTSNARWYSHRFPDFLAQDQAIAEVPSIAEVARIERAIADAFDAANDPVLTMEDLGKVGMENIERATFTLHPSVTVLRLETNAYDIFKALKKEDRPPEARAEDESRWIIGWRRELMCRHMEAGTEEGMLLDLVRQGYSFARLCEVSATVADPDNAAFRMAGYLTKWIENHMISGVTVTS